MTLGERVFLYSWFAVFAFFAFGFGLVGYLPLMILLIIHLLQCRKGSTKLFSYDYLDKPLLYLLGILAVTFINTSIFAQDKVQSIGPGLLFFIILASSLGSVKRLAEETILARLMMILAITVLITDLLSIWLFLTNLGDPYFRIEVYGLNPNYSSTIMLIAGIPAITYLADKYVLPFRGNDRSYHLRALALSGFAILTLAALLMTKSRGALLGLGVGLIILSLKNRKAKFVLLTFLIMLVSFTAISDIGFVRESSDTARVVMWQIAIQMLLDNPLTGVGLGSYGKVYPEYYRGFGLPEVNYAHNLYLHLVAESGLPGIVTFMLFIGMILYSGFKLIKCSNGIFHWGLFISIIAVLARELVDVTLIYSGGIDSLYWLFVGLLLYYKQQIATAKCGAK